MAKTRHIVKETPMLRLYVETEEHGTLKIRTYDCTCGNVDNDVEKALQDLRNLYQTEDLRLNRVAGVKRYTMLFLMDAGGNLYVRSKGLTRRKSWTTFI